MTSSEPLTAEFGNIDIVQLAFGEFRWWLLACVIVFAALATTAAFIMTPKYHASVVLIGVSSERTGLNGLLTSALGQLGGLASQGANLGTSGSGTEEAVAVLKSRQFTERFINDENLIPELYWRRWDSVRGQWTVPVEKQPTPEKAFRLFDERVRKITRDTRSGLITMQIEWKDRVEAAKWANELVDRVNEEMRARAIRKADDSIGFLQRELMGVSDVGTRDAINRLIETEVKQRMLADVTKEYAFRVVDRAFPPDADQPAKPKKALMIAIGPVAGFMFGIVIIYLIGHYRLLRDRLRGGT